jgi:hypothetical protein
VLIDRSLGASPGPTLCAGPLRPLTAPPCAGPLRPFRLSLGLPPRRPPPFRLLVRCALRLVAPGASFRRPPGARGRKGPHGCWATFRRRQKVAQVYESLATPDASGWTSGCETRSGAAMTGVAGRAAAEDVLAARRGPARSGLDLKGVMTGGLLYRGAYAARAGVRAEQGLKSGPSSRLDYRAAELGPDVARAGVRGRSGLRTPARERST